MFLVASAPVSHPDLLLLASLSLVSPLRVERPDKTAGITRQESLTEPLLVPTPPLLSDVPPSDILTLEDDDCAAPLVLPSEPNETLRWEALPELLLSFLVFGSLFSLLLFFGYTLRDR